MTEKISYIFQAFHSLKLFHFKLYTNILPQTIFVLVLLHLIQMQNVTNANLCDGGIMETNPMRYNSQSKTGSPWAIFSPIQTLCNGTGTPLPLLLQWSSQSGYITLLASA